MTTMMMTKRTTTKSRLAVLIALIASVVPAGAQRKPEPYAVILGSVFQESGRSQPGAKAILAAKEKPKKQLQEQVSNSQGEFAFRVPPGPGSYIVAVSLKGFVTVSKEVEIAAQEQIHKTFSMIPASN